MVRVASLPDLSRFIRRSNKLPIGIYNTIHLLVGTESVEVSGCVLSLKSSVLEDLVGRQREVYLDQFAGEFEGVQDCVELMYGGDVELNEENVKTVIKFSVLFEIEDVYNLGMEWLKGNITGNNLFGFIEFGLLIEIVGKDNHELLDLCTEFIGDDLKDGLNEISKGWDIGNNANIIKFLIQAQILYHTLPVLTTWISVHGNDANVSLILTELDLKGIGEMMWKFGDRSIELLEAMNDRVEILATMKRLNKVQTTTLKRCVPKCSKNPNAGHGDLRDLLSDDYCSFTVEKMMGLEDKYDLNHFQFVEILLAWVMKNKPAQEDMKRLWDKVRQQDLCFKFVMIVHHTINNSLNVPKPVDHGSSFYKYLPGEFFQLEKDCNLTCFEISKKCNKCKGQYTFKMKLVDTVVGYELEMDGCHISVAHCHLSWDLSIQSFSLLTNSYDAAFERVSQTHRLRSNNENIWVEFAYNCTK